MYFTTNSTSRARRQPRRRKLSPIAASTKIAIFVFCASASFCSTSSALYSSATTSQGSAHDLFRGVSDDSALARTMGGGTRGDEPYSLAAPGAEPLRLSHGTTTVAMLFDGGVIAAVDSRASMGSFVGSRTTQKVIPVSDRILGTMAGGAADCTFWLRYLGMQAKVFENRNGRPMSVSTASRVLADTLMAQRGRGLSVGTMVMGYDVGCEANRGVAGGGGGAQLYYVDSEGARMKGRYFSVGSGSTYAYSVLDEAYRPGMSLEEAADLARRAVRHATYRDAFSGGFINVFVVNASGWSKIGVDDAGFMKFRQHDEEDSSSQDEDEPDRSSADGLRHKEDGDAYSAEKGAVGVSMAGGMEAGNRPHAGSDSGHDGAGPGNTETDAGGTDPR